MVYPYRINNISRTSFAETYDNDDKVVNSLNTGHSNCFLIADSQAVNEVTKLKFFFHNFFLKRRYTSIFRPNVFVNTVRRKKIHNVNPDEISNLNTFFYMQYQGLGDKTKFSHFNIQLPSSFTKMQYNTFAYAKIENLIQYLF